MRLLSEAHTHLTVTFSPIVGLNIRRHHEAISIYDEITALKWEFHFLCWDTSGVDELKHFLVSEYNLIRYIKT